MRAFVTLCEECFKCEINSARGTDSHICFSLVIWDWVIVEFGFITQPIAFRVTFQFLAVFSLLLVFVPCVLVLSLSRVPVSFCCLLGGSLHPIVVVCDCRVGCCNVEKINVSLPLQHFHVVASCLLSVIISVPHCLLILLPSLFPGLLLPTAFPHTHRNWKVLS